MTYKKSNLGFHLVSIVSLALTVVFLIQALTPYGSATSPDSISYLDIAYNFKNEQGLVTTNLSFNATGTNNYASQRLWPPAYPALLSAFIENPFDVEHVRNLSGILLLLSAILILLTLRTAQLSWLVSLLIATLSTLILPMVVVYTYAWSETLFIPILLSMVLVVFRYLQLRNDEILQKSILIGLFTLLSLALFFTRYIGLVMIVLFPIIYTLSNRCRSDKIIISLGLLTYAVPTALFLADNHQVTGSISGGTRSPSLLSLGDNLQHLSEAFATIFPTSLIGAGLGIALAGAVIYGITATKSSWSEQTQPILQLKYISILSSVAILYLGGLLLMRTHTSFDQIDVRLIAPAVPILILGLVISPVIATSRRVSLAAGMASLSLVFMLALKGFNSITNATISWRASGTPSLPMRGEVYFNNFSAGSEGRADANLLKSLVSPEGYIFIQRPLIWRFLTQHKTFSIPSYLDRETIYRLNEMPKGSIIITSPSEAKEMESMLEEVDLEMRTIILGQFVGVRLPFSKKGQILE